MQATKNKNIAGEDSPQTGPAAARPPAEFAPNAKKFRNKTIIALAAAAVIALAAAVFFYVQTRQAAKQLLGIRQQQNQLKTLPSNSVDSAASELRNLVEAVGRLIILPDNEQPTIATVTDLEKLKGQAFFASAQAGDKVLIYANAKKAILYRPDGNKIIELAPLNTTESSPPSVNSQSQPLTVEIRNGSGKTGAAQNFKLKLAANSEFSVTKVGNAVTLYQDTLLYVTDAKNHSPAVVSLQELSSAKIIDSLPAGEPSGLADAILILGRQ